MFIGVLATIVPLLVGISLGSLLGYNLITAGIIGCFFGITAVTVSTRIFKDYKFENKRITNVVFYGRFN